MTTSSQIASHLLRARIGKICAAVSGSSPEQLLERAAAVLPETQFLEFRLDYLAEPARALPALSAWLESNGAATVIATCRRQANAGQFAGTAPAQLEILLAAARAGFHIVDVEIESAEALPKDALQRLREAGAAVLLSFHDFESTGDLDAVYRRMEPFAPDFIKVVTTARRLSDNIQLMRFLERAEDRGPALVVGICMGEAGVISRVLGLRAGSAFTFAAASAGAETAPGQLTARTLLETYRVDAVDVATRVYGVAGDPIACSLSPLMLNTAFRRETVDAVYLALQTGSAEDLFELARAIPISGLSVTMPLKQAVLPMLERCERLSTKIGAVNTILRAQDGKFYGFNTDVAGIVGPLERRLSLRGASVLVLGAGGAARAAVFACRDKGADVAILNRTPETARKLAQQSGARAITRADLTKSSFDVLINATPAGMAGNPHAMPLAAEEINARLVFDLVYNPLDTPLLKAARAKGLAVISGVEMFVQQGARQFEIWTGKPAPQEEMLRVVLHALRQHGEAAAELPPSARLEAASSTEAADAAATSAAAPKPATASKSSAAKPGNRTPVRTAVKAVAVKSAKSSPTKAPAKAAVKTSSKPARPR